MFSFINYEIKTWNPFKSQASLFQSTASTACLNNSTEEPRRGAEVDSHGRGSSSLPIANNWSSDISGGARQTLAHPPTLPLHSRTHGHRTIQCWQIGYLRILHLWHLSFHQIPPTSHCHPLYHLRHPPRNLHF